MSQKFYRCEHCGNIIAYVKPSGVSVICCGEKMKELIPGTVDASLEKHVPVITVDSNNKNSIKVSVGAVAHPMGDDHYIEWISLQTREGNQRKELKPGMEPSVEFMICDSDEVVAAFAYCNLHGLWKSN